MNFLIIVFVLISTLSWADVTGVKRVVDLTRITSPNVLDVTYCADVSDTSGNAAGTDKKCRVSDLFKAGDITVDGTNTGVGTTTPTQKVDVVGTVKATAFIGDGSGLTGVGSGASVSDAVYGAGWNGDTTVAPSKNAVYDKIETLSGGGGSGTVSTGNGGYITYYPSTGTTVDDQAVLYTDNTNIGVGSANPTSLLDVNGSLAIRGNGNIAFSNGVILNSGTTSILGITGGNVGINSLNPSYNLDITGNLRATSSLTSVGVTNTGSYTQTGSSANTFSGTSTFTGSAAFSNAKSITTSGNVGVGSATPGTALDVTGTARATAFSGPLTGNASTATALAANPTNCSAGNYPLGIDASGNVESCTSASGGSGGWTTDSSTKTTTTYNVGIGSVDPTTALDVNGVVKASSFQASSSAAGVLQLYEASANGSNYVNWSSPATLSTDLGWILPTTQGTAGQVLGILTTATGQLNWSDLPAGTSSGWTDGGTTVYTTTSTDNVGIGTTASFGGGTKLTVKGGSGTGTSDFIGLFTQNGVTAEATGTSGVAYKGVWVMGDGGSYYGARDVTNDIELLFGTSSLGTGFIGSTTNHPMQLRTNATSRLAIDASGNVGISTTIPTSLLEVTSTAAQNLFRINDNGSGDTSPFIVTSTGNVGIGSVTPGSVLDIQGAIRSFTSTSTTSVKAGANTACNTTCAGSMCLFGQDTIGLTMLACTDATADTCLCLGP